MSEFNPVLTKEDSRKLWDVIFKSDVSPELLIKEVLNKKTEKKDSKKLVDTVTVENELKVLLKRCSNIFNLIDNVTNKQELIKLLDSLLTVLTKAQELFRKLNKKSKQLDQSIKLATSLKNVSIENKNVNLIYLTEIFDKIFKMFKQVKFEESDKPVTNRFKKLKPIPFSFAERKTVSVIKAPVIIITKYPLNNSLIKALELKRVQNNCYVYEGKLLILNTDSLKRKEKPLVKVKSILDALRQKGNPLFPVEAIHTEYKNYYAILCIDSNIGTNFTILTNLMIENKINIDFA